MKHLTVKKEYLLFFLIVFIQCILCLWAFGKREGLFIDELWTFNLANSYYFPMLTDAKEYFGSWLTKDFFSSALTVSSSHRFAYDSVWFNQAADVHPPLYYLVIHTVCSFYPNYWNEWLGLIVNLFFFVGTQFVLFLLSKKLNSRGVVFAFWVCLIYGCSIGAINTVVTIRMYMMLTFFTVLALWLNVRIVQTTMERKSVNFALFLFLYLSYLGGVLTQYFFVIPLFFVSSLVVAVLLLEKNFRILCFYVISTVAGVLSILIIFPAAWYHTFGGGYRGEQAISLFQHSEFVPRLINFWNLLSSNVPVTFFCLLISLMLLIHLTKVLRKVFQLSFSFVENRFEFGVTKKTLMVPKEFRINLSKFDVCGLIVSIAVLCSFLVISRITDIQDDRYLMFIFPMVCLAMIWTFTRISEIIEVDSKILYLSVMAIFLGFTLLRLDATNIKWRNAEYTALNNVLESADRPQVAVYVDKNALWWPAMEQVKFFMKVDKTLLVTDNHLEQISFYERKQKVLLIISRFSDTQLVQSYLRGRYPNSTFKHMSDNWHGRTFIWEY